MTLNQTGLERIKAWVDDEKSLIEAGLAHLRFLRPGRDYAHLPPEMLIEVARRKDDPTRFAHPNFLRWAAVFHKHLAIHHYPEGEDRIGFRYPPR